MPTGLEVHGKTVYMAQAGQSPDTPEDGSKVISIDAKSRATADVGQGAPLLVDVETGLGRTLFALAQGEWNGAFPGAPANPDGGSLVKINSNGSFTGLVGEIWVIEDVSQPPFGVAQ